ncbi:MAG: DNA-3-methyladenine glycosylase [Phycisphaerales bacterium]|jgi:DNA-3-methyladenine glycosylase|nr:DNA-3-methyladenine glycosylase [Phycisphaerales bacterium]
MRSRKLRRADYAQPADVLARELVGKLLVHRTAKQKYRARIVETEAYLGPVDLASHASKGLTGRTKILFGSPGFAYVYLIYGMYDLFNIVAGHKESGQAVLIRAAEPLDGWKADLRGPGKLTRAMHITRQHNGIDLTGQTIFLLDDHTPPPALSVTPRIGIDYAKHWKDAPLRFFAADHPAVSGKKSASRPKSRPNPPR